MRHTPKLLALEPILTKPRTSSKEAVHKFFSLYYNEEAFNENRFETSETESESHSMPKIYKSVTSLLNNNKTDKSTISASSFKSTKSGAANYHSPNKVKFSVEY
jgi:hypothetical protein